MTRRRAARPALAHVAAHFAAYVDAYALLGGAAVAGAQAAPAAPAGKAVYDEWCAGCHGVDGKGDGPAADRMLPQPRDFTRGVFQIRTTASGELPTDADLQRVIDEGMPGTAMPGWKAHLTGRERSDVLAYIKTFSTFFAGAKPTAIALGSAPAASDAGLREGRAAYRTLECFKCHGEAGRGDGPSAPTLKDDWGHPIRAADLTASWRFNGGSAVEQIHTRLRTGLDGTPMPSYADAVESRVVTAEQLWRVAQYVRSLSPERPPEPREVIRAARVERGLPRGPADSAWAAAPRHYVPLVGQVIRKPRWFAPTVHALWVQALHDDRQLALRVTWTDPSRSPSPAWNEWLERVRGAVTSVDAPLGAAQGPDRLALWFPAGASSGGELPYFLGGSARRPVYALRWTSDPDRLEEGTGTGLGRFAAQGGAPEATHSVRYANGEWQLQVTRALTPRDTARGARFAPGAATPIAFFAADGSNGEDEVRGAVSAWYAVHLDVPTPRVAYASPVAAMLVTAGLGSLLVRRAQRRARDDDNGSSSEREAT
ncbi:MAG: c-type cytochrome [Gemmatimonadaceae bacterium]